MTKTMLILHRWLGLVAGLLILLAATTAIGLNHREWFRQPTASSDGPFAKYLLSTAVDPTYPRRILVGTNDGFFRSVDGGKTWEEIVLPVPAEQVGSIQFDPAHPGRVYAVFRAIGVYRSEDHGDIWEEVALPFYPPEGIHVAGLSLDARGAMTLATTAGMYREQDGDWQNMGSAKPKPKPNAAIQLMYDLHDGRFWGSYGVPITDGVSVALIMLVASGYFLCFGRGIRRRRGRKNSVALPPKKEVAA